MPANILIIDDSDMVRGEIVRTLGRASLFDACHEAQDGIEGFKILLNREVDLVLCDLEMPRMDGFKFIAMMQTREELKDTPVILLTGRGDQDLKIKGLEQGACDYVTKPFDAGELIARVKVQLKIKALQDELKRSNELLKELSNTDPLTRIYNRRYLMEAMEREFERARRRKEPLSLVMIDIDHFKQVNDTYGHQEGDIVLAGAAALIAKAIRGYDICARYGGEEFVVVLPETSLNQALQFADRFRTDVQKIPFGGSLKQLTITISLGVATFPSERVDCLDSLFRQADEAMYRAKQKGRNRVESMAV